MEINQMGLAMPAFCATLNDPTTSACFTGSNLLTGLPWPAFIPSNDASNHTFDFPKLTDLGNGYLYPIGFNRGKLSYIYRKVRQWTVTTPSDTFDMLVDNIFTAGPAPFIAVGQNPYPVDVQSLFFPVWYALLGASATPGGAILNLALSNGRADSSGSLIWYDGSSLYFPNLIFEARGESPPGHNYRTDGDPGTDPVASTLFLQDMSSNPIAQCPIYDVGGDGTGYGDVTMEVSDEW